MNIEKTLLEKFFLAVHRETYCATLIMNVTHMSKRLQRKKKRKKLSIIQKEINNCVSFYFIFLPKKYNNLILQLSSLRYGSVFNIFGHTLSVRKYPGQDLTRTTAETPATAVTVLEP